MTSAARSLPPRETLPTPCAHCGSPVPTEQLENVEAAFCCAGCRSVYEIVHAAGLSGYYAYREGELAAPVQAANHRGYEELDDAQFQERHCQSAEDGSRSVELLLEGLHCSACVWLVERLGRIVPGVLSARVDLSRNVASLRWDPTLTQLSAIARGLASLGYPAHPLGTSLAGRIRERDRALLLRLGVAGAAAGNVMLLAFALYSGAFSGMDATYQTFFRWVSLAIATPTVFWAGSVFLRGGYAAIRTRTPHMDLPVSVGIITGYLGGAYNTLTGRGEIFFDSLCTLIFLLLVGRYLQQGHHRRSSERSELMLALAPQRAHVAFSEGERDVPIDAVQPGSIVRIASGERVPIDGIVLRGKASIDVSLLTGEPMPVDVSPTDRVYAGTRCDAGELWVTTVAVGGDTRLGRLMTSVETTQRERAPIVRLADRVSGHFVVAILAIAALTFLGWLRVDTKQAFDHAIALLVVTCPCALGMATPLSVSVALGRAAKAGLLFKGGEFMEELAKPGLMVFDKTGTLTEGQPELVAWTGDVAWQAPLRAMERGGSHPLARSVQRAYPDNDLVVEELVQLPRGGLSALVAGKRILVGAPALLRAELGSLPGWAETWVSTYAEAGRTPVVLAADGAVKAVLAFGDRVRPEAKSALAALKARGFRFEILSGDHQGVVSAVARELGIAQANAHGAQTPEAKLARVSELKQQGERVIMVGDGVNDAAAMAAATVGIAVHGGAETCLQAADVFATRAGLTPLVEATRGSARTLAAIRRGIVISLTYNVVGIGLAALGILSPLLAAIMMPLSSISVVSLALRARTFEGAKS